jgi:hypothetical protein
MPVTTQPITDAADDLANALTEGAEAVDELAQGIVNALVELDKRLEAVEEGSGTEPPVEPPIEPPAETGTIPITFNDPMFSGMTERTSKLTLNSGQNLTKTSIKEQSGDPSILCHGNNKITTCRVQSRECIRITDNALTVDGCYLEAKGSGNDHADTLQAYSPGARGALVTLKNTHVRAFNQSATAGYFTADNWGGTIIHNNVIYQGGPYGLRVISDPGCHIDVDLENVFFVGPFGYGRFLFQEIGGGTLTIRKWVNVRDATIQNGKLVPGNIINKPSADELEALAVQAAPRPDRSHLKSR